MATLTFPDPSVTQEYEAAGITWTWNATLGVWSTEAGGGVNLDETDTRYLRVDADAGDQERVAGKATFARLTTHYKGISIRGKDDGSHIFTDNDTSQYIQFGGNGRTLATFATDINNVGTGVFFGGASCHLSTLGPEVNLIKAEYNNGGHGGGQDLAVFSTSVEVNTSAQNVALNKAAVGAQQGGKLYAYYSNILASDSTDQAYNFFAGGDAPNYFKGDVLFNQTSRTEPGTGNTDTGACMQSKPAGSSLFISRADNLAISANRNSSGLICSYRLNGLVRGEVVISPGGCNWNSVTSFAARTEVPEFTDAVSVISQLKAGRDGFAAEDIEAHLPGDWAYRSEGKVMFDNTRLIPILTKALQEALKRIEALEEGAAKATTRKRKS